MAVGEENKDEDADDDDDGRHQFLNASASTVVIVRPVGHFGAWDRQNMCRVDSATCEEDAELYRCSPKDFQEVLARMSDADAAQLAQDILL